MPSIHFDESPGNLPEMLSSWEEHGVGSRQEIILKGETGIASTGGARRCGGVRSFDTADWTRRVVYIYIIQCVQPRL